MKKITFAALGVLAASQFCFAGEGQELTSEKEKINYSVGFQIGGDFKQQGVELETAALVRGVEDALREGSQPLLGPEERYNTLVGLKKKIDETMLAKHIAEEERNRVEGKNFLTANAAKEGVKVLASGLQYKIIQEGSGNSPTDNDMVTIQYRSTTIDGREFDNAARNHQPVTIPLKSLLPGLQEMLPLLKEGAKVEAYLPANLAFGDRGPLADKTVIYEVELLAVKPAS